MHCNNVTVHTFHHDYLVSLTDFGITIIIDCKWQIYQTKFIKIWIPRFSIIEWTYEIGILEHLILEVTQIVIYFKLF